MRLPGARSEHPGDDGEGHGGAAGLQLQGHEEALGGGCVIALSLEDLAQPVPDLVGRGVHLHRVPEYLLREAVAAQLMKDQGLWASDRQTDSQLRAPICPWVSASPLEAGMCLLRLGTKRAQVLLHSGAMTRAAA